MQDLGGKYCGKHTVGWSNGMQPEQPETALKMLSIAG